MRSIRRKVSKTAPCKICNSSGTSCEHNRYTGTQSENLSLHQPNKNLLLYSTRKRQFALVIPAENMESSGHSVSATPAGNMESSGETPVADATVESFIKRLQMIKCADTESELENPVNQNKQKSQLKDNNPDHNNMSRGGDSSDDSGQEDETKG